MGSVICMLPNKFLRKSRRPCLCGLTCLFYSNFSNSNNTEDKNCPYSVSTLDKTAPHGGVVLELPCGLVEDSSITLVGIPDGRYRSFQIELVGSELSGELTPPIILNYNVSLPGDNMTEEPFIVQNTWTSEAGWGTEERCPAHGSAYIDKEFSCHICRKVMSFPLTTPCAHNFCKACLEGAFAGQCFMRQRTCEGRRTLRAQKSIMKCPVCSTDIADFLQNPQVNRELMELIESLQGRIVEEENAEELSEETDGSNEKLDEIADNTEISDVNCGILEEAKDTAQIESKTRQADKRKKTSSGKCTLNRRGKKGRRSTNQPDSADVENGLKREMDDSKEPEDPAIESKVQQTCKRKQYSHGGNSSTLDHEVKTRSKRAKMQVVEEAMFFEFFLLLCIKSKLERVYSISTI